MLVPQRINPTDFDPLFSLYIHHEIDVSTTFR